MVEPENIRCCAADRFEARVPPHTETRLSPFDSTEWSLKHRVICKISCKSVDLTHVAGRYNDSAGFI
jgi:hypothetical protein